MVDGFGRTIDYLRVSVTDRCNFRCIYCMPDEGYPVSPKAELLTFEEMARLVHVAADLGITKVRITGGEPLVRRDLAEVIARISEHPAISDLSLTTNGHLMEENAKRLKENGLDRVNISLDTLDESKFVTIARRGNLSKVKAGVKAAFDAGLTPIKVNCVLMKGVNDDEVVDFARWTLREPVHVRFIEIMPIRWNLDETDSFDPMGALNANRELFQLRISQDDGMLSDAQMRRMMVPCSVAKKQIEHELGEMQAVDIPTNGPARSFRLDGAAGSVGFISQISDDLCKKCNRLRLTADGQLRPCLMADGEVDLRGMIRSGASDDDIRQTFLAVVRAKPERHYLAAGQKVMGRGMSQLGG